MHSGFSLINVEIR